MLCTVPSTHAYNTNQHAWLELTLLGADSYLQSDVMTKSAGLFRYSVTWFTLSTVVLVQGQLFAISALGAGAHGAGNIRLLGYS